MLAKLFYSFMKIGAFTIGGGYAMIPIIENEIVKKNNWISDEEFWIWWYWLKLLPVFWL